MSSNDAVGDDRDEERGADLPERGTSEPSYWMLLLAALVSVFLAGLALTMLLVAAFLAFAVSLADSDSSDLFSGGTLIFAYLSLPVAAGVYVFAIRALSRWIANYRPSWPEAFASLAIIAALQLLFLALLDPGLISAIVGSLLIALFLRWRASQMGIPQPGAGG